MRNGLRKSIVVSLVALFATWVSFGVTFTYQLNGASEAVITKCPTSTKGAVSIPASLDGYVVTGLADDAFSGCKKITSITVPKTVENIGSRCFKMCSKLNSFTFAGDRTALLHIGDNVFEGAKLNSLVLPPKTVLADEAFFDSKIITLEVQDADPSSYLYNLDDALSPYTGSGSKLKLRSAIKKLIVPRGKKAVYESNLYQFLYGRKKKNWGTVVAQYPRVYVDKSSTGTGASYFKLNGKKLANGAAVKPGTKNLQFVSVGAADYAPQHVSYKVDGVFVKTYDKNNSFKITMPSGDVTAYGTFVTKAEEKARMALVAIGVLANVQNGSLKQPFTYQYQLSDSLLTKTTFTYSGLPKGLKHVNDGGLHKLTGTPTTAVDYSTAPIFVTIKAASGYSITLPLQINVGTTAGLGFAVAPSLPQAYNASYHCLSVLGGVNYAKGSSPVSFDIPSGWKISAKKGTLPAGIKLVKTSKTQAVLAGRPTKPGTYVVEVVLTKGKQKKTARFAYTVYAHPLKGSYRGYVNSQGLGVGLMTMTVDSVGKATLSFTEKSTKTTIKNVYAALRSGTTWDASKPLEGQFTYTFKVPKDKKRKVAARTLKLAYASDASSGVADAAHVRNGPMSAFSLTTSDGTAKGTGIAVRCYPQYSAATAVMREFYRLPSSYYRTNASFASTWAGLGGGASSTDGETALAETEYYFTRARAGVRFELPYGGGSSAEVPLVCPFFLKEDWTKNAEYSYVDVAVAPILATDWDGSQYMVFLPTDPSEISSIRSGLDRFGFFRYNADGTGSYSRFTGMTTYYRYSESAYFATPVDCVKTATPAMRIAYDTCKWTDADKYALKFDTAVGKVTIGGKAYDYQYDPLSGDLYFEFQIGSLPYCFVGVPSEVNRCFLGRIYAAGIWDVVGSARIMNE